jgi:hypothetical protein
MVISLENNDSKVRLKKVFVSILDDYYKNRVSLITTSHSCFLSSEERVMLKDLIKVGKYAKNIVLVSLAVTFLGVGFLGVGAWFAFSILKVTGLAGITG